jgi:hypothetical protein
MKDEDKTQNKHGKKKKKKKKKQKNKKRIDGVALPSYIHSYGVIY